MYKVVPTKNEKIPPYGRLMTLQDIYASISSGIPDLYDNYQGELITRIMVFEQPL